MTSEARPATRIGDRAFRFEPHHCFACGELNEHGLKLDLHAGPEGCRTELTLDPRFQGWDDVAHGGIIATILDEVMAWSVIGRGTWGVTARMTVDFRRPVRVGRRLLAIGEVSEMNRRLFRTRARLEDVETHEVLATADGTYLAAPPERLAELQSRYRLRPVDDEPVVVPTPGPDRASSPDHVDPNR